MEKFKTFEAAVEPEPRHPLCPNCNSDDLEVEMAIATWTAVCRDCGTHLTEKPISAVEKEPAFRCPKCGGTDELFCQVRVEARMDSDGEIQDIDKESAESADREVKCRACGFDAPLHYFEVGSEAWNREHEKR